MSLKRVLNLDEIEESIHHATKFVAEERPEYPTRYHAFQQGYLYSAETSVPLEEYRKVVEALRNLAKWSAHIPQLGNDEVISANTAITNSKKYLL